MSLNLICNYYIFGILMYFFRCFPKMKFFVLMVFIPSLIVADVLCPNSKTSCPEGKHCCEVDGEYSCCDPEHEQDVPDIRMKVYPGDELISAKEFHNSPSTNESKLAYCDYNTCLGTCCGEGCCPQFGASCCRGNTCCPSLHTCCNPGCCAPFQNCCGDGCCESGTTCCGSWCCKKGHRCGSRYKTCRSKGTMISPEILVLTLMAATAFVSRRL